MLNPSSTSAACIEGLGKTIMDDVDAGAKWPIKEPARANNRFIAAANENNYHLEYMA